MVLETTRNANRFLRLGPPPPLMVPIALFVNLSFMMLFQIGGRLYRPPSLLNEVLRPGCVLPPSLLFQTICAPPPVSSYSPAWWYGRGCWCVCVLRPLMWWNSVSYVLQIWPSVSVRFPQHTSLHTPHSLSCTLDPQLCPSPTGSFGWTNSWRRVLVGLKYVGIPYPPKVLFSSSEKPLMYGIITGLFLSSLFTPVVTVVVSSSSLSFSLISFPFLCQQPVGVTVISQCRSHMFQFFLSFS